MRSARWAGAALGGAVILCLSISGCRRTAPAEGRVVVVAVAPQGAGAQAGLRPGDILLSYRRAAAPPANPRAAAGAFDSCRTFAEVEAEQAERGALAFTLVRDGRRIERAIPHGPFKVQVRPRQADSPEAAAWNAEAAAEELGRKGRLAEARAQFARALALAEPLQDARFTAWIHERQGLTCLARRDFACGESELHEALRRRRQVAPGSLGEAELWFHLGRGALGRRDLESAEASLRQALALQARLAPGGFAEAMTYRTLAAVRLQRGDPAGGEALVNQALARIRKVSPGSLEEAHTLSNLAVSHFLRGEKESAEDLFRAAGEIFRRLDPDGESLPSNRANLGSLAVERGDYALGEELLQEALARFEKLAPDSLEVADLLNNLGNVARERSDFVAAEAYYRRALALRSKLAPGSLDEAQSLSALAVVALDRQRLDEGERLSRRAYAIRKARAPQSVDTAISLLNLSHLAHLRGNLGEAEALIRQGLAAQRAGAPGNYFEAPLILALGESRFYQEDWPRAEAYLKQAIALYRRHMPLGFREAMAIDRLGQLYEKTGRLAEAEARYGEAVAAVEGQIGRVGGSEESQASFLGRFSGYYQDLIRLQLRRGRPAEALKTLERSRGRTLLRWLSERHLAFGQDVPAELSRRLRRIEQEYERTQAAMASPAGPPSAAALRTHLFALRDERVALMQRISQAAPRYAALKDPHPLELAAIRDTLDPGTVWLSYCVLPEETLLFVVAARPAAGGPTGATGITVLRLPWGEQQLTREVAIFRSLLLRGPGGAGLDPALVTQGQRLYQVLISPAAAAIAGAERVLVSPDGPLHLLPFAALVRPGSPATFLVEEKPLHTVLSATVYAELRHRRPAGRGRGPVVAFADPAIERGESAAATRGDRVDGSLSPLRRYRGGLSPLPGGRTEARTLAALFGADARVFEGAAATEEQAKKLGPGPRLIHFACHALLDGELPLDSALALAPGKGGDNGLLQAWEIFEQLRLDADLVTLSACSTGLGKSAAGEGLIGLTRAFQYAGARSVLASLWEVSDQATAELMKRFYTALAAGRPKDVALAEAQRALLRSGNRELAHPGHWAAFELIGDWR